MRFDLNILGLQYNRSRLEKLRSIRKSNKYYKLSKHNPEGYFRTMYASMRDIRVKNYSMEYTDQRGSVIWVKLRYVHFNLHFDLVTPLKRAISHEYKSI